jgi:hypothetical protein
MSHVIAGFSDLIFPMLVFLKYVELTVRREQYGVVQDMIVPAQHDTNAFCPGNSGTSYIASFRQPDTGIPQHPENRPVPSRIPIRGWADLMRRSTGLSHPLKFVKLDHANERYPSMRYLDMVCQRHQNIPLGH